MPEPMSDERLDQVRHTLYYLCRAKKRESWEETWQHVTELLAEVERLRRCDDQTSVIHELRDRMAVDRIKELEVENAKLRSFKDYVHNRLDDMGVPVDPPGEHRDAGCRIGQRLYWVRDELETLRHTLSRFDD